VKEEFSRRLQNVEGFEEQLRVLKVSSQAYKTGVDVGMLEEAKKARRKGVKSLIWKWLGRIKK
jgi:hypothetical protein